MREAYSLTNVLERIYRNQVKLEAAIMELTLHIEKRDEEEVGRNVRRALQTIKEKAGFIKQGLARFKKREAD
ncbi:MULTISPECIES: hypothetical protein [Pseudomonas]|uniref:hypothetical protein n=1 Tax=Pseudomonas TaxID=286 RepID=UPI000595EDA9|nr:MULTISPECIES: hypothetical protein [Pseudomonas]QIB03719.1 hypothetical protein GZ982_03135 [Pseudomonas fluorescens]MCD9114796.1 hypothetical protein [Pseudomonas bijieensis]MDD2030785.1 hypothetical protein [Pseudomonas sp. 39167]OAB49366.1 hypothetical protein APS14_12500 [Pseudomonas thivervalensis]PBJ22867.1 hypothetical protein BSG18_23610 [Pseudomonas ogarae]